MSTKISKSLAGTVKKMQREIKQLRRQMKKEPSSKTDKGADFWKRARDAGFEPEPLDNEVGNGERRAEAMIKAHEEALRYAQAVMAYRRGDTDVEP
jgi:hypothetical protein